MWLLQGSFGGEAGTPHPVSTTLFARQFLPVPHLALPPAPALPTQVPSSLVCASPVTYRPFARTWLTICVFCYDWLGSPDIDWSTTHLESWGCRRALELGGLGCC